MQARTSRSGWSEQETEELMEQARRAREEGKPLREVFEATAFKTGRKPNSIRNYYYARSRDAGDERRQRFTPFDADEAERLTEQILTARAGGESVRACVTRLAGGDQRLMLRYQNKYRAMLKSRPDVVERVMERLRGQGLTPPSPYREHSAPASAVSMEQLRALSAGDRRVGDMLDTLAELISGRRAEQAPLATAARQMLDCIRQFASRKPDAREDEWGEFICDLVKRASELEHALDQAEGAIQ